jgi:YkoY family integral membrane protein
MFGQTFDLIDVARLSSLTFLEILLSADNALVLGLLSRALPPHLRQRALHIGVFSAFIFRAIAILLVFSILDSPWVQLLGAAYLIYLSIHHFVKKTQKTTPTPSPSFWKTVLLIEFFDIAFAFDSIIAGIAFISTPAPSEAKNLHPKLWIVYTGGMLGLFAIRFAANFFSRLLDRFPRLETSAYLLVALIGIKLALDATFSPPGLEYYFWGAMFVIFASSFFKRKSVF